ncbi:hypothetical protein BE04_04855 [Sorangium cellulosum]|uniref:histidine kinase n=1 Tax=Sorangium cellulosum TaxID=56 RepID=A0A150PW25_SORCE|nr:hypothetical protein BE04_04855 [Sorangium cellulosum]
MGARTVNHQGTPGVVWLVGRSRRHVGNARRALAPYHDVDTFAGGRDVLARLARGVRPTIMAIDGRMPRRAAAAIVASVREVWDNDAFPLLVISETEREQDIAGWLAAGVNDCLTRPFGAVELVSRVSALMRLQRLYEQLVRERIERDVQDTLRRFRTIADALPHILWMCRGDGAVEYYNSRWSSYTGGGVSLLRLGWARVLHPEDVPRFMSRWDECRRTGEDFDIEARLRRHDGAYRWHLHRARAIRYAGARAITRWIGTCTDVDDLKRAEAEAAALVGGAPLGIGLLDRDLRWRRVNEALAAMSGLPREALVGRGVEEVAPELQAVLEPLCRAVLSSGEPLVNHEIAGGTPAAPHAERHYLVNGYPVRIGDEIIGLAALILDITERKRAERRAEEASRLKDEFLATMSHELRTPLNAILGWATMMSRGLVPEGRRAHAIAVIERNARAQAQLIEDLLDISRITSGELRLETTPVAPLSIVESSLDVVQPAAEAKKIRLERALDRRALTVMADPDRLRQIVLNLLTNAVKFTREGGEIRTSLRRAGRSVEIAVEDNGQGISRDFLPYVFERFRQADASTTREHGGLGLGLAIARHLVELHGGTIEARSEGEGRGATFLVRLPLVASRLDEQGARPAEPSREPPPTVVRADLAGLRVVVVEDDVDACEMLGSALAQCRAHVELAVGAAQGLELVRRLRPDLLLADIAMPGEDGYALIRSVRALSPEDGGKTAAIAVTACAGEEDRARALGAGFDLHVAKPVDLSQLLALVGRIAVRAQMLEER